MRIKIYVEGGGQTRHLQSKCREGFRTFLRAAGVPDSAFSLSASGSRNDAFSDFCVALRKARVDDFIVLLVDSEEPVGVGTRSWVHLKARDNWDKPAAATDENAHLMVQCMEAWFVADKDTLAAYFGEAFHRNALPSRTDIDNISKHDLFNGLRNATHQCKKKGEYGKGKHSFDILARIDPAKVKAASPFAQRFIEKLMQAARC